MAGSSVPIFRGAVLTGPGVALSAFSPQSVLVVASVDEDADAPVAPPVVAVSSESSELQPAIAMTETAAAIVPLKRYLWDINILLAVNHRARRVFYDAYDRHSLG